MYFRYLFTFLSDCAPIYWNTLSCISIRTVLHQHIVKWLFCSLTAHAHLSLPIFTQLTYLVSSTDDTSIMISVETHTTQGWFMAYTLFSLDMLHHHANVPQHFRNSGLLLCTYICTVNIRNGWRIAIFLGATYVCMCIATVFCDKNNQSVNQSGSPEKLYENPNRQTL